MSEQTSQEPTMEEILASIRRIISEDEPGAEPAAEAAAPAAEAEPEPAPEPAPSVAEAPPPPAPEPEAEPQPAPIEAVAADEDEDDTLELTQKVETHGDLDVLEPTPAPIAPPVESGLVGEVAAQAAASAFGQLSAAIAMPAEGRTLEDVVRELLRPLLQQWLDANLPGIVQQAVAAEVERISRTRVR